VALVLISLAGLNAALADRGFSETLPRSCRTTARRVLRLSWNVVADLF